MSIIPNYGLVLPRQIFSMPKKRRRSQHSESAVGKKPKVGNGDDASPDYLDKQKERGSSESEITGPGGSTTTTTKDTTSKSTEDTKPAQNVQSSRAILVPPFADDASIRKTFDVHVVSIGPTARIESKVRQILTLLQGAHRVDALPKEQRAHSKQSLIVLVARSSFANKCISIAEISKREYLDIEESAARLYQYTAVWSQLELYERHNKALQRSHGDDTMLKEDGQGNREMSEQHAKSKVRNVSCLAIYLGLRSIQKLKDAFSEQTAVKKPAG